MPGGPSTPNLGKPTHLDARQSRARQRPRHAKYSSPPRPIRFSWPLRADNVHGSAPVGSRRIWECYEGLVHTGILVFSYL